MEIYGTLGPACAQADTLARMLELGMTGLRLNLSHITLAGAEDWLEELEKAAALSGVRPGLLIDMQGPELRVGALAQPVTLPQGKTVTLGAGGIPVPEPVLPALTPGREVLLDDGKLLLRWSDPFPAAHGPGYSGAACSSAARASPCRGRICIPPP